MDIGDILNIVDWTRIKIRIHIADESDAIFPYKREIWWAYLGQNIGVEANGENNRFERPILVIKVFNKHSLLVAPITSRINNKKFIFIFKNELGEMNAVNVSQMRSISVRRLKRKMSDMSEEDFDKVISLIRDHVINTKSPSCGDFSESPRGGPNSN